VELFSGSLYKSDSTPSVTMKTIYLKTLAILVLFAGGLHSQIIDFPQSIPVGAPSVVTTVTLREVELKYVPPVSLAPVWVQPGSTVRLQLGDWAGTATNLQWTRSTMSRTFGATTVLEIKDVSQRDSDAYRCLYKDASGKARYTEAITLLVGQPPPQRLAALSNLVRITPDQPMITMGFIVKESGNVFHPNKELLIRAVGPSLNLFGVANPLARPQVRIFSLDGTEVAPVQVAMVQDLTAEQVSVGLTPLPVGSPDVVRIVNFPPGGYSVQLSSSNGGTGAVLLEIYEITR
jgi:hypothetical protein